MSRPKSARSSTKSKTPHSEAKTPVEPTPAAKPATPESTPDESAKSGHGAEEHKKAAGEEKPWSEWLWSEEGQMCYRGRQDSKGEWEYDFAPLPPLPKERPYTPPRGEPIEYLIEELKIIWEPRIIDVPGGNVVTVTPASKNEPSKAGEKEQNAKNEEVNLAKDHNAKVSKEDEKESKAVTSETQSEKSEKSKSEKRPVRRGRQLERPERRQPSYKERKERIEGWRRGLE